MIQDSPALRRLRASAGRILGRFGGVGSFERAAKNRNWEDGSTTNSYGDALEARCQIVSRKRRKKGEDSGDAKVSVITKILRVEVNPFVDAGRELTENDQVTYLGQTFRLGRVVMSKDELEFQAEVALDGR